MKDVARWKAANCPECGRSTPIRIGEDVKPCHECQMGDHVDTQSWERKEIQRLTNENAALRKDNDDLRQEVAAWRGA